MVQYYSVYYRLYLDLSSFSTNAAPPFLHGVVQFLLKQNKTKHIYTHVDRKKFERIFLEKRGKETPMMCKRNTNWLSLACPQLGTWPATQACALTGNPTSDPLVCRIALNPLSYTSQGLSLPLVLGNVIMMCLGVWFLGSNFFGTHWASWKSIFFARLRKFSFIMFSK